MWVICYSEKEKSQTPPTSTFVEEQISSHLYESRGHPVDSLLYFLVVIFSKYASILACVKDQEENLGAEKASKYVIDSERYYVQRRDTHEFLVCELASPEEEPCEEDRIVRVFPNPESAYHFADAANAMQRKLDTHAGTSWSVRAV